MNLKKLNEELENILEDIKKIGVHPKGFTMVGKGLGSVDNFLQKYIDKYGNLTIPEFIDVLMKKEKNGEDVLEESLNEDKDWSSTELMNHKLGKLLGYNGAGDDLGHSGNLSKKTFPLLDCGKFGFFFRIKKINDELIKLYCNVKVKYGEEKDIHNMPGAKSTTAYRLTDNMAQVGVEALEPLDDIENPRVGYWDVSKNCFMPSSNRISFNLDIYTEEDLEEQIDYLYYCLDVASKAMLEYYNKVKLPAIKKEIQANNATKKNLLDKRKQILLQAKNKASNITVKQALSKSSVAKKIQALKNPTPEQLAKILAAIELDENIGSFILTESLDDLDEPIEDEYKEIREVLRDFFDREINFPEFVTIKQLKDFDKEGKLDYWEDRNIIDCAKEEGYEVDGDKIITPDTLF